MAEAIGGAFLSASLQVLFDRLASPELINFFRGQKLDGALLNKLKTTLLAVYAVLNDAEEKQIANPYVKAWLDELKDATYDAEDLLDEIATDVSRCKLEAESHDQVRNLNPTSLNLFNEEIKSKIEGILEKLEYIAKQKKLLGLKEFVVGKPFQKLPTTSLVDGSCVYGRDDEREKIVNLLLTDDASGNEICVIAIVGLGGVGKTTLAQLVYNDDKVNTHFDLKVWVCVSEEFDVIRVTKTILNSVTLSTHNIEDLNILQIQLKESIMGKKFLLVLDDVWIENYVDRNVFQEPFKYGAKGSKIIVTTRNENVASIMRAVSTHHLERLTDEASWLLFAKHAFGDGNSSAHPNLEVIGREIVEKCKGLPLAIKTLGDLLWSKQDVEKWNKILKSSIWDLPQDRSNILPALSLSYHYLSPHLKRCFAYCSIFPKDFEFKKEQLVLLWMAEGLLQHGNKRLEDAGVENFHHLVSRSFFQLSVGDKSCFVMHDLISDLAQFVSRGFCFRLEGGNSQEIPEKTRYLSFCRGRYDASKELESFYGTKFLRTFLRLPHLYYSNNKVLHDILPTSSCLRVLSLSNSSSLSELPESIGTLKHLRYVDLSHSQPIRRLPDSTSTLFNLQTLILSRCYHLTELPIDMWKLINLRHLYLNGTRIKQMPRHMSKLISLQTLDFFVVGKDDGFMINELRELRHLRGLLHVKELQNVVHARDASEVRLKDKEHLDELVLEWGESVLEWDFNDAGHSAKERDLLDKLRPHINLKKLTIKSYRGTTFPDWLGSHSFCNMVSLCLRNCSHCLSLPPLGQLPCLKSLYIARFDKLESVGPEFCGSGPSAIKPFRLLTVLSFEEMKKWAEWFCLGDEGGEFPCLKTLYIKHCPMLNGGLPSLLPSLEKLCIENCRELNGGLPGHLPSLTELEIRECQQLVASLPKAPAIRYLRLENCDKVVLRSNDDLTLHPSSHVPDDRMISLPERVGLLQFSSIERLEVSDISQLNELPPRLQELNIKRCPLKFFPKGGLPPTLKFLFIEECMELDLFPPEETMHNYYESLSKLEVNNSCDLFKSFPLGLFPTLKELRLVDCKNLESLWILEGPHKDLTSFRELHIGKSLNLTSLFVYDCDNLKSLPERMHTLLPFLQELVIGGCPELEQFSEGSLPSNLCLLSVFDCDKLTSHRMEWGLQRLASLKGLKIGGCEEVESFPEEWLLPSTLTSLSINSFSNLKYLTSLEHLTSLEKLSIIYCPELQCLPEEGLPASLSLLEIWNCPLLLQRCEREKGEYWPKIAHIPNIWTH